MLAKILYSYQVVAQDKFDRWNLDCIMQAYLGYECRPILGGATMVATCGGRVYGCDKGIRALTIDLPTEAK